MHTNARARDNDGIAEKIIIICVVVAVVVVDVVVSTMKFSNGFIIKAANAQAYNSNNQIVV